jgi:hypothetical protein
MAKILRLWRQQRVLRERREEMLRRGLRTLNELDALEEKERLEIGERERAVGEQPNASTSFDVPIGDLDPSDPFWASLGFGGETPQASQGT